MLPLRQALDRVNYLHTQVMQESLFRGFGPVSTAATGVLAVMVAAGQSLWLRTHPNRPAQFLAVWLMTAVVGAALAGGETYHRTRSLRSRFGGARMVRDALEQLLPALVAGFLLSLVVAIAAPHEVWLVPGLWQLAFGLGIFASCRNLPRPMFAAGLWYLAAGLACVAIEAGPHELSPWSMGAAFGIGQLLVAAVLTFGFEESD